MGSDTTTRDVINLAKGFPMGASCRVVIVKRPRTCVIWMYCQPILKSAEIHATCFAYMKKGGWT